MSTSTSDISGLGLAEDDASDLPRGAAGYIACQDCDLIHKIVLLGDGETARCTRCGAVLYRQKRNSLDRSLTLTITGLILFGISNAFPFMTIEIEGRSQHNSLISGVIAFWQSGYEGLSVLVFLMSIMLPLMTLLSMLYVLLPLKLGRRPWKLAPVYRIVEAMRPWAMMEVFMLGVLVALVKLADFATVIPGVALYTFGALIIVTAASSAALDSRIVWEKLSERS